jgi:hypothetical protein
MNGWEKRGEGIDVFKMTKFMSSYFSRFFFSDFGEGGIP